MDFQYCLNTGYDIFALAGVWHNVRNTGNCLLKLSPIYAPPHHPKGMAHRTWADTAPKN